MKPSLHEKLDQLARRLNEIDAILASEGATDNMDTFRKLSRERAEIEPVVNLFNEYRQIDTHLEQAKLMLTDPEMRALAEEEIEAGTDKLTTFQLDLQKLLLPKDPNDERNIFLEIRAGTGGDESAIFTGDLFDMYCRYANTQGWSIEIISENPSELGGYREIIALITGRGAYSRLKFESGAHRVQRVPETEAQGRIHTSACTVAILPEVDEVGEVDINPADLRIDTYRASGAGGQHVNRTNSAIRITHLPTGIVVECQDDRSQHRNKDKALSVLAARIRDAQVQEQQKSRASERKSLVGTGDRSERIRTYNFPQGRITDHRINMTWYKIDAMMAGDLDEMLGALAAEYQAEQLAALALND